MWINVCGIIEMRRWISTCQLFCCENHNAPKVWHNLKARNLHPAMPKLQQVGMIWVYLQDCIPSHRFWSSLILGNFLWTNPFRRYQSFTEVRGTSRRRWVDRRGLALFFWCFNGCNSNSWAEPVSVSSTDLQERYSADYVKPELQETQAPGQLTPKRCLGRWCLVAKRGGSARYVMVNLLRIAPQ